MKFKFLKNKEKNANLSSKINKKTREKFILKGWIESNRKATCTKNGTRGFLCRLYKLVLNGKMTFSCPTTCTDSYTRRENRCQIPFKTSLTPFKMDFSLGRSMVEMLGVLAIIGVLSIGGIQGYTIAMRRYKANEIVATLSKFTSLAYVNFQNYIMNNPSNIRLSHYGAYECSSTHNNYWEARNCPFIDESGSSNLFNRMGMGSIPNGVISISLYDIVDLNLTDSGLSTSDSIDAVNSTHNDLISVEVYFNDQELCKTVSNMLSAYTTSDGRDGYDCLSSRLIKGFPVN